MHLPWAIFSVLMPRHGTVKKGMHGAERHALDGTIKAHRTVCTWRKTTMTAETTTTATEAAAGTTTLSRVTATRIRTRTRTQACLLLLSQVPKANG